MHRRTGFWIALVIVVLLGTGGGGAFYYRTVYLPAQISEENPVQTATVRRGDIIISASGAGSVIPADQVDLGFLSGGLLTEVLVQVGDEVGAGDVLASLDDTQARKAVVSAELQVVQAQEALAEQLDTVAAEQDVALAEANLALAQLRLDELLNWTPDEQEVERAQASLEAAQADHEATVNRSPYDQTTSARISLEQAQASVEDAQEAYDTAWDPARDWELYDPRRASRLEAEREAAVRNLERAQQNLEVAQANYNLAWAGISDSGELNAWNQVLSAQAALEAAQTGPTEMEIQSAHIQVLQAEIALAQALEKLESGTEQAELTLAQAELNLEVAQKELAGTTLLATMDGTVMAVTAQAGESLGSAPLVTLADVNQPSIGIYLDETDLNSVGVGLEVEVVFDALPDDTFTGHVVQVDPALVSVSGVSMVRAVVRLDESSYAKPRAVPIGANASVDVIGGRAENALLVPVEALNEITPGQYAVFVMKDGELVFTAVEVGLTDYSFAEILSGLEQGDVVTTGIVETN